MVTVPSTSHDVKNNRKRCIWDHLRNVLSFFAVKRMASNLCIRMVNFEQSREEVIGDNVKDYSPFR
jgi:hypothetical protein